MRMLYHDRQMCKALEPPAFAYADPEIIAQRYGVRNLSKYCIFKHVNAHLIANLKPVNRPIQRCGLQYNYLHSGNIITYPAGGVFAYDSPRQYALTWIHRCILHAQKILICSFLSTITCSRPCSNDIGRSGQPLPFLFRCNFTRRKLARARTCGPVNNNKYQNKG